MIIDRVRGHSFIAGPIGNGSRIVDLGMNEGRFAAEMRAKYGCRVIGVEANPALAARIGRTPDVQCFNVAIAPERGEIEFYIDIENSEASGLARDSAGATAVRVPGMPLADFLAEHDIAAVDLLKIDIEGAELELLERTAPEVLSRIGQISLEFHIFLYPDHAPRIAALLDRLRALGFFAVDFSRNWEDALLVNQHLVPLSEIDKLSLLGQKYRAGLGRMLRRRLGWHAA